MAKIRVSTTVDATLLAQVRALDPTGTDASLLERAFTALWAGGRGAEGEGASGEVYAPPPADEPDTWGDLATFGAAVARS